jgi:uncharacterized membrane protein
VDSRRAESFSDGVFAVAITILVFNLLPIASETAGLSRGSELTWRHVGHYWPAYLAYLVSFLTIGIMWLNHHKMLAQVRKVDRPVLVLNLILLMGIVALPFPTALVAAHLVGGPASHGQAAVAAVTYGLVMMFIAISFACTWLYVAAHAEQLGGSAELSPRALHTIRFTAGNAGYLAATLIALVSPIAALIIYGLLAVYYLFDHLPTPETPEQE